MKKIVWLLCLALSMQASAQKAPAPTIRFYLGDKVLDPAVGVTAGQFSMLRMKIVPDSSFAIAHPDDTYTSNWKMYVRRGSMLGAAQTGSGESMPTGILNSARPGDAIAIEIDDVTRTDANGKKEKVKLDTSMKYLSIVVR